MDFYYLLVLVVIVGSLFAAYKLYEEHGISWTFGLAGPAIVGCAFLILYVLNVWGIGPIRKQAEGTLNQVQDLTHLALPAVIPQSKDRSGVDNSLVQEESQDADPNAPSAPDVPVEPPAPKEPPPPPEEGDVQWWGAVHPGENDPAIPFQLACISTSSWQRRLLSGKYQVPRDVMVTIDSGSTFWTGEKNEVWTIRLAFPHNQMGDAILRYDGVMGRQVQKALGSTTVVGAGSWPLVQRRFTGNYWEVIVPVVCR